MVAPCWLDRREYPFADHTLHLADGRMHYVDEGRGPPVLMVHGTPTWSFLFRELIKGLSADYRVIAPDLLGFGLSDKRIEANYVPEQQAHHLKRLIEVLELEHLVLVVHDFGGPIGLSYAVEQPQNVRGLVLFNTWMWSRRGDFRTEVMGRVLGSRFGRWLYESYNFSPRVILKASLGDRRKVPPHVYHHYTDAFASPAERKAPWVMAHELLGSSDWYEQLWERRERIAQIPALLLWGLRDPAFRVEDLTHWQELFAHERTVLFPDAGHLVPEEAGPGLTQIIREFLQSLPET